MLRDELNDFVSRITVPLLVVMANTVCCSWNCFSWTTLTPQNRIPCQGNTKNHSLTSKDFFSSVASVLTAYTWPLPTLSRVVWARSMSLLLSLASKRSSSSQHHFHPSYSFWALGLILLVIWWSWLRGLALAGTSWSSLLWDRDKKRWVQHTFLVGYIYASLLLMFLFSLLLLTCGGIVVAAAVVAVVVVTALAVVFSVFLLLTAIVINDTNTRCWCKLVVLNFQSCLQSAQNCFPCLKPKNKWSLCVGKPIEPVVSPTHKTSPSFFSPFSLLYNSWRPQ